MLVGIVGKPNVGKSTFFSAATLKNVPIADYPFTTITPNVGMGYLRTKCVCREMGVTDTPRNSVCTDGTRLIPVKLVDVAGLVAGASEGRGRGNQFLDEIRQADALIHVVDASGGTDEEGRKVDVGSHDPASDVKMIENELDLWVLGIVKKDWEKSARLSEQVRSSIAAHIAQRLSGLGIDEESVEAVMMRLHMQRREANRLDRRRAHGAGQDAQRDEQAEPAGREQGRPTRSAGRDGDAQGDREGRHPHGFGSRAPAQARVRSRSHQVYARRRLIRGHQGGRHAAAAEGACSS